MNNEKPTILIVDDIPGNIQIIGNILSECDYEIEFATNGSEALDWMKTKEFDLVLLDIMMPGMDGFEVIRKIKDSKEIKDTNVIFITAKSDTDSIIKGLELGAVDYIVKPFHKKELLARIRTHITIIQQRYELEKANAFKSKILSVIGHDLRDPIGSLKSYVDAYLEFHQEVDDSVKTFMHEVSAISENAFSLLENLLSWAKSQTRGMVFSPQQNNVRTVVEEAINLLSNIAFNKKISFINEIDANRVAYFDYEHISIVIRNLAANAVKFSFPGGKIRIQASETVSNGEKMLLVSVIDNGLGLNEVNIKNLFKKDFHYSTYGTNNEKGSGLGLKICQEFVELNGGSIYVESQENVETKFSFTIPLLPKNQII